jgi:ATP-dependent protease Clp ATPase subunit
VNSIQEFEKPAEEMQCSFCARPASEVGLMIYAHFHACICSYCVVQCVEVISQIASENKKAESA